MVEAPASESTNITLVALASGIMRSRFEPRGRSDLPGRLEIRPGLSNMLKIMSRLAPNFILKQLGKSVDRTLAQVRWNK